jgi:hypothetical protein
MAKVNKQCKEHIEKIFFLNYKDKCNRDKFASCILLQTVAKNRGIGIFIVYYSGSAYVRLCQFLVENYSLISITEPKPETAIIGTLFFMWSMIILQMF